MKKPCMSAPSNEAKRIGVMRLPSVVVTAIPSLGFAGVCANSSSVAAQNASKSSGRVSGGRVSRIGLES